MKRKRQPDRQRATPVREAIDRLLDGQGAVRVADIVRMSGASRQAAHKQLVRLVRAGEVVAEGAGPSRVYRRTTASRISVATPAATFFSAEVPLANTHEHEALERVTAAAGEQLRGQPPVVRESFDYAFTEMFNNAIDHSGSARAQVKAGALEHGLWFEIADAGIGAFERLRQGIHVDQPLAALQELTKGKLTTLPARHSGEGIFFTSKVASRFELEANGLIWLVDNVRGDTGVEFVTHRPGTRVRVELDASTTRPLREVFNAYTSEDNRFDRTRTWVKLFAINERFVSRSEAKRLLNGLEKFRVVTLDFEGVRTVGQGFVDEVFRVWPSMHPETRIEPVNMNESVRFMVERGLPRP